MSRIVCWFSCGAASAVATKLTLSANLGREVVVAYTEVMEEHPDNRRFLADCERWFGQKVVILRNEKYEGSIYNVFRGVRYLKGPDGAACTRLLKKGVRQSFELPGDAQVFGYTADEAGRWDRFLDANNINALAPLIDKGLMKADVLAMVERAGIELPVMYRLGYNHNNCIGCVKGEAGYWNKIRVDFPATFERMAQMEEELGRTVTKVEFTVAGKRIIERPTLRQLDPSAGNYAAEPSIECSIFCEMAESEFTVSELATSEKDET